MPKIIVNGKSYEKPEDLPPDAREEYQKALGVLRDENLNGIPDILEGKPGVSSIETLGTVILPGVQQFIVDGKSYANINELPPEARMKYDQAVAKLGPLMSDVNGNGIPDMLEGKVSEGNEIVLEARQPTTSDFLGQNSTPSVFHDETPNYGRFFSLAIIVLLVVAILGLGVFLFQILQK